MALSESSKTHEWRKLNGSNISWECVNCGVLGSIRNYDEDTPLAIDIRACGEIVSSQIHEQ